jgi:hypothetical protein
MRSLSLRAHFSQVTWVLQAFSVLRALIISARFGVLDIVERRTGPFVGFLTQVTA